MGAAPPQNSGQKPLTTGLVGFVGGSAAAWALWPTAASPEWRPYAAGFALLIAGSSAIDAFNRINALGRSFTRRRNAHRPGPEHGEAAFLTVRQADKAGLLRPASTVVGQFREGPVGFCEPVHSFVLAPASAGKTTKYVIPKLCLCTDSMLVSDLKGELAATTAVVRVRLGHEVVILNPAGMWIDLLGPTREINPISLIVHDLATRPADAIATATAYAKQLVPVPPQTQNLVFYQQAQRVLALVMLYVAACGDLRRANMGEVARIITNPEALDAALAHAMELTDVLQGELADRALAIADMRVNEPKLFNNCHISAVQAMQPFSRAGLAAEMMSGGGDAFDPIAMKTGKVTVYMVIDPSRIAELGPVAGLISQYVLLRLTRAANNTPVRLLLDEATNLKIEGLAEAMTALRGFGIGVDFIAQSLSEVERVYGRFGRDTIINQSDLKLAIGPMGDVASAELWSKMLGKRGMTTSSFAMGQRMADDVQQSHAATSVPLMRIEELMTLPKHEQIAITPYGALRQRGLTFAEIDPIKFWVGVNPLEGRWLKAKTRVRLKL